MPAFNNDEEETMEDKKESRKKATKNIIITEGDIFPASESHERRSQRRLKEGIPVGVNEAARRSRSCFYGERASVLIVYCQLF